MVKIKVNDVISLNVKMKDEMTSAEFLGIAKFIEKVDKQNSNVSGLVKELKSNGSNSSKDNRAKYSKEDMKKMINEWTKADTVGKKKIAKDAGISADQYSKRISYFKQKFKSK